MTTLLLIRHGENDYLRDGILIGSIKGIHLNEQGHEQANALAESLECYPLKAIYSSPLERAVETAAPLAKIKHLEPILCPALTDTDVGDWAGSKIVELRKLPRWEEVQEKPSSFIFPGGESFAGLQLRIMKSIKAIAKSHKSKDIVAVFFHADPIKLAIAGTIGLPLDNFQCLSVETGSVSILKIIKNSTQLVALNIIPPFSLNIPR